VIELLEDKAKRYPENFVEVFGVEKMTFEEWGRKSSQLAHALLDLGVKKGDKVAIMFSNKDAAFFKISYFAITKVGALPVPVNVRLPKEGVKFILENSEAKGIIFGSEFGELVEDLKKEVNLGFALERKEAEKILEKFPAQLPQVEVRGDDYLDIIYTSGTTGFPKEFYQLTSLSLSEMIQFMSLYMLVKLFCMLFLFLPLRVAML